MNLRDLFILVKLIQKIRINHENQFTTLLVSSDVISATRFQSKNRRNMKLTKIKKRLKSKVRSSFKSKKKLISSSAAIDRNVDQHSSTLSNLLQNIAN